MKRKQKNIPSYRLHKASGRAFVELNGHRHYLGPYDNDATRQAYHRLINEWLDHDRQLPIASDQITVVQMVQRFWQHAKVHYRRPDGSLTSEPDNYRQAIRPLVQLYGEIPACQFGPRSLRAVRHRMVEMGWCRTNINKQVNRIRHVFKWAASEELIDAGVYHALQTLDGLKRGRSEAHESDPVRPVPRPAVRRVRPHLPRQVRALIDLQLLSCARADELVRLRPVDLDTSGKIWKYTPPTHKTAHQGKARVIYFGPRAQQLLRLFLTPGQPIDHPVFSPRQAETERHAAARTHRPDRQKPNRKKTTRVVGDGYTTCSYRRAIHRACDKAGVARWSPHRLRHNAGTLVRRGYGLEAAQVMLGHARVDVTQIYAEVNDAKAIEVAGKVG